MIDMLRLLLSTSLSLFVCACASPNNTPDPSSLEETSGPEWRRWTPSTPRADVHLPDGAIAFDYWRLEPGEYTSELWAALFPILSSLRTPTCQPSTVDTSIDILLTVLEPVDHDASALQMDLTFALLAEASSRKEWLILRAWRVSDGATPALTIAIEHDTSEATPTAALIWGYPGYERAPAFSAKLTDATIGCDADAGPLDELTGSADASAMLSLGLMRQLLWDRVTRDHYTTPTITLRRGEVPEAPFADAAGLPRRARQLEEIDSRSHFPPVVDLDDTPFE